MCKEVGGSIIIVLEMPMGKSFRNFKVMLCWSPEGQQVDDSGEPVLDKDFFYTLRLILDLERHNLL